LTGSGRLRTSQLWFRITVARLRSVPYLTSVLIVALVAGIVMGPKMATHQRDTHPEPVPTDSSGPPTSPTPHVLPTRTIGPVPDPTTRPPSRSATHEPPPSTVPATPVVPAVARTTGPAGTAKAGPATAVTTQPTTTPTTTPPTTTPPTTSPPAPTLTVSLSASPVSGKVSCGEYATLQFDGTIAVDRPATVTWSWSPEPDPSSSPTTHDVTPERAHEDSRTIRLTGEPGTVYRGVMKLVVSAPGAEPVTKTKAYSVTCA
jgi:hypothetical protein